MATEFPRIYKAKIAVEGDDELTKGNAQVSSGLLRVITNLVHPVDFKVDGRFRIRIEDRREHDSDGDLHFELEVGYDYDNLVEDEWYYSKCVTKRVMRYCESWSTAVGVVQEMGVVTIYVTTEGNFDYSADMMARYILDKYADLVESTSTDCFTLFDSAALR